MQNVTGVYEFLLASPITTIIDFSLAFVDNRLMNKILNLIIAVGLLVIVYLLGEKRYFYNYLNDQDGCYVSDKLLYDIYVNDVDSTQFLEVVPSPHSYTLSIKDSNLKKLHVPQGIRFLNLDNVNCPEVDPEDLGKLESLYIRNGNVNLDFVGKLKNLKTFSVYGRNYIDFPDLSSLENLETVRVDLRVHEDDFYLLKKMFPKVDVTIHWFYVD